MLDHFIQKRLFRKERRFQVLPDGMMKVLNKSATQQCEWTVSLAHVNPEFRQVKVASNYWLYTFFYGLGGIVLLFLFQLFSHQEPLFQNGFLVFAASHLFACLIALIGYFYSKYEFTVFHYDYEGEPVAFGLFRDNPDEQSHQQFIDEISEQIKQARLNAKELELARAMDAIEFLTKERVISESASSILLYRIEDIDYFANEE